MKLIKDKVAKLSFVALLITMTAAMKVASIVGGRISSTAVSNA